MTDRGARPSLWRRPGLFLRTTGDVTPVTIYNSAALRPSPLEILFASSGAAAVLQSCAQSFGECFSAQRKLLPCTTRRACREPASLHSSLARA